MEFWQNIASVFGNNCVSCCISEEKEESGRAGSDHDSVRERNFENALSVLRGMSSVKESFHNYCVVCKAIHGNMQKNTFCCLCLHL